MQALASKLLFLCLCLAHFVSCGGAVVKTSGPSLTYYLERMNTNATENYLIIEAPEASASYTFKISGTGFSANVPLDEDTAIQERTLISYPDEDLYQMNLQIKTADGFVFIEDTLAWEYSLEPPPLPIVNFSEKATADNLVILLLGSTLGAKTTEIWVEGDLEEDKAAGSWITIPSTLQVPLFTSASDGLKSFRVKYRNIYGNESDFVSVEILKKSAGPSNCLATTSAATTRSAAVRLQLSAENEGDLFYTIIGDLEKPMAFESFTDSTVAIAELSPSAGPKELTVKMRDVAGNYCPDLPISLTYDPSYIPYSTVIEGGLLWTDTRFVNLINSFDFLPSDTPEVYISGGVVAGPNTFAWIPYEDTIAVELAPLDGNRFVYTRFRYAEGTEGDILTTHTYLRPSVSVSSSGSPRSVTVSHILGLVDVTISGCQETYEHVAYETSYDCTPQETSIIATYYLTDDTSISRSALVP